MLRLLSHRQPRHTQVVAAIGATVSCTFFLLSQNKSTSSDSNKNEVFAKEDQKSLGIIETDVLDKIAHKSYLNYHPSGSNMQEKTLMRPSGVPETLRILVIDLPEFREMFDEECAVDLSAIFPDGIAYPNKVKVKNPQSVFGNNNSSSDQKPDGITEKKSNKKEVQEELEVMQKSMVRSLSKCGKKNKTILLEASVSSLNPRNMKRRFTYRPNRKSEQDEKSAIDEQDFPWYQKAWIEEMELRISGKVPFSEPLAPSSKISRIIFGTFYHASIPLSTSFLQRYILFPFMTKPQQPDGVDSDYAKNRASNKPHAVIADGAAMYSVPGSLLHLSRCCKEANVPLFVVNDPRTWGHNTHADVTLAARDLRKTVKNKIIQDALKIKLSSSFERGRKLGKVETQLGYELKEASDKTMKSFLEAKKSLEGNDWSTLDEQTLKTELIKRKLISIKKIKGDNEEDEEVYACTEGMRNICRKCLQVQDTNITNEELNSVKSEHKEGSTGTEDIE